MAQRTKRKSFRTRNINPGAGFAVTAEKYAPVRRAVLGAVPRSAKGITFAELLRRIKPRLKRKKLFPKGGSVMWYAKVVQLDLEKRGYLRRIPRSSPLRFRRVK